MYAITGLPRGGSTLLCNILNQNDSIYASHTSPLCKTIRAITNTLSSSVEFIGDLGVDRTATELRLKRSVRAFCHAYYEDKMPAIIFDKSRGWTLNSLVLKDLYPQTKIIVVLRDLLAIFGSIEKQERKTILLNATNAIESTIDFRATAAFSKEGVIGLPLNGIQDLINRKVGVYYLRYEDLVSEPRRTLASLYEYLEIDSFEHDLDNIENTAKDPDNVYLFKYPHEGCGKLSRPPPFEFREYFGSHIEKEILDRFTWYYQTFYSDGILNGKSIQRELQETSRKF